jgi:enoyl-[acyl-carrier protein] reductase I
MGLLTGKKALIFGIANNKSIAYGIAKKFSEEGAELAISYAGEKLESRVAPIAEELGAKLCVPCDVSNDEDIAKAFDKIAKEFGNIDILVHSIAYAPSEALKGRYIDTTRAAFNLSLDISAYSLVALCKAAEPIMNEYGSVINLSYYGAEKVVPNYNLMGVAKAALECSTRYLACDLGAKNIRINSLSAGPIKTLAASGIGGFKNILSHIEERAPLHRNVTIEDVGDTATFLACDLSKSITGETLYVDSGYNVIGV